MMHQRVELARLVASAQPRPLVTEAVDKLASSIRDVGLIQPITVKACSMMIGGLAGKGFQIVAGHHRVAACRALGWTEIDAIVIEAGEHLQAELIEIDENLCRSELTAAQRSKAIKRRKEIWEALHPVKAQRFDSVMDALGLDAANEIQVEQLVPPEIGYGKPPQQDKGFAAETASISGETKQSINRRVAIADALGDDLDKVVGTSLDKGVELAALAKLPEEQRAELIERAQAGEKVTARKVEVAPPINDAAAFVLALSAGVQYILDATDCTCAEDVVDAINKLGELDDTYRAELDKALDSLREIGTIGGIAP